MQEASVFIVHLWSAQEPETGFRASVHSAGADEFAWFTEANALVRFLLNQSGAGIPRESNRGETS